MTEHASRALSTLARVSLVFVGGACGGCARAAIALAWPVSESASESGSLQVSGAFALLAVNVSGSLLAGYLVGVMQRSSNGARKERIDAFAYVGFCGGFTSYSAFVALLMQSAWVATALGAAAALATFVLCPFGCALGMHLASRYPAAPGLTPRDARGTHS